MKVGELYWNVDPVILYANLNSALWDAGSVHADDFDGPLRCSQLSDFLNKPIVFCGSGGYFLVVNVGFMKGTAFDTVEVLHDDRQGWIVKRDFICLLAATK